MKKAVQKNRSNNRRIFFKELAPCKSLTGLSVKAVLSGRTDTRLRSNE
jgi:hypothetical protein